jgi:hypothetical protein
MSEVDLSTGQPRQREEGPKPAEDPRLHSLPVETTRPAPSGEFEENERPAEGAALPPKEPYNPEKTRELARVALAGALTTLLAFLVVAIVIALINGWYMTQDALDLLGVLLSPLVALVGAATGFYYGEKVSR